MLFILRYVVLLGQPRRTTDVIVHPIAKCIVYSTTYRHEHRYSRVFNVLA
jgi:hypothetical protein